MVPNHRGLNGRFNVLYVQSQGLTSSSKKIRITDEEVEFREFCQAIDTAARATNGKQQKNPSSVEL